ncbi:MAG: penicillin acylase family protein [Balneolaceae bacterium]
MNRLFRGFLFLIVTLGTFLLLGLYWTFYRPLPDYEDDLAMDGLHEQVDVHWDSFGVPHIYARNRDDLYRTLGYLHAQERIWQMTLSQLVAQGRFAEFFGADLIPLDRYHRTLGFHELAQKMHEAASPDVTRILESYAAGVNEWIDDHPKDLPVEFALTGLKPIRWSPVNAHAMARLMAWEMNVSWWSEMALGYLSQNLPASIVQDLIPEWNPQDPVMMSGVPDAVLSGAADTGVEMLRQELKRRDLLELSGAGVGSNAWVVSADKSATGAPILAGDPHMALSIPGNWYEVHLSLNGRNLSGATLAGAPVVVLGQNDHYAWSLTNMMADDTDFFLERLHPEDSSRVLADTTSIEPLYEDVIRKHHVLRVKGEDDHLFTSRWTRHGPIINDIYPEQALTDDHLLSMKWTGHEVSQELEVFLDLNWGTSMETFREALSGFRSPGQNIAYADRDGNIAIFSAAGLPIRNGNPVLYRPGWDPGADWQGWIPFDELPSIVNPEKGYAANANQKLHDETYPWYIGTFWEPPSRTERIEQWLERDSTHTVESMQTLQFDTFSPFAQEVIEQIVPVLRSGLQEHPEFDRILPYLENWDYHFRPESTAATLLDVFLLQLGDALFGEWMEPEIYAIFVRTQNLPSRTLKRFLDPDQFLFGQTRFGDSQARERLIRESMSDALDWLREEVGPEPIDWRWEQVHRLTLYPPLFGDLVRRGDAPRLLEMIVTNLMTRGPFPVHGHAMSVNKAQYQWSRPFETDLGPAIRRVVDLSNIGRSYAVLPTGQSGNPFSEFYGDQTDLWLQGNYRHMVQDSTFFREVSYTTNRFFPSEE